MQAVDRRRRLGARRPSPPARPIKTVKARELLRQISRGRVGVRRPGHAVRHHHQPVAHRAQHRPHQRLQPVLASTCTSTTRRATSPASTCSSTSTTTAPSTSRRTSTRSRSMFTAQEILVGNADYPTEKIAENSRKFRQLGLGYANLGALLMAQGMPYDSDGGRAWAAALTALMTGHAYATSARTAGRMGPFAGYADNADAMNNVLRMHRAEAAKIDEDLVPPELLGAAQQAWDEAVELGETFGVRNSQATRARAHRHHRPDDGLRHHRHRARPRAHQGEEARRWRHDDDRQPDDPACAAPTSATPTSSPTRSSPTSTSTRRSSGRRTSSPSTCRCSRARWATTRSTTWVT